MFNLLYFQVFLLTFIELHHGKYYDNCVTKLIQKEKN